MKILFLDDTLLHERRDLNRRLGEPRPVPQATYRDPDVDLAFGYPTVFREPAGSPWRALVQGERFTPEGHKWVAPLLLESDDGWAWRPADTRGAVTLADRRLPHQLLSLGLASGAWSGVSWGCCYVDAAADPAQRYKAFLCLPRQGNRSALAWSADAVRWQVHLDRPWHPTGADPGVAAFRDDEQGMYVLTLRPGWGRRAVAVSRTADWRRFSPPQTILEADALDSPCAELYGMPVFRYEDLYLGLLWVYHTDPAVVSAGKGLGGRVDCQLVYSRSGSHFVRGLRGAFLANSPPGEDGSGCLFPSSLVVDGGQIRIYSSSSRVEHALRPPRWEDRGALVCHTLRRDGFAYLQAEGAEGIACTRPLLWQGEGLELNVEAPQGTVAVELAAEDGRAIDGFSFAECSPFRGDALDWVPLWRGVERSGRLAGRRVRIRVRLRHGRLYALSGSFALPAPARFDAPLPAPSAASTTDGLEAAR